ncbi:MAG: hypothetical protein U0573_01865 [Phycisphaerales bacterium]
MSVAALGEVPGYKVAAIPRLPGATFAEATAVNNKGDVVGRARVNGVYRGFRYDGATGEIRDLGELGPDDAHGLWGINDSGLIVGTAASELGNRAILISPLLVRSDITQVTTVFTPMVGAEARAINSLGRIAGSSSFDCSLTNSSLLGSRWSPGGFFVTPLIGSNFECATTAALAINELDDLAGWATMNVGTISEPALAIRPFVANDEGQTPLPTFSSPTETGIALGIGTLGDVCGIAQDDTDGGRIHPALWLNGAIFKLQSLGGGYRDGSIALSVNGATNAVGRSGDEATGQAVIWISGNAVPTPLTGLGLAAPHSSGYRLIAATAISDGGFIVGRGVGIDPTDTSGSTTGFLLLPCTPVITQTPVRESSCLRGTVTLSVQAVGAGPLTYQWQRNGIDLENGEQAWGTRVRSATTARLEISGFRYEDEGVYSVRIGGSCGESASAGALITVCRADLSCDGVVTDTDFSIFVQYYNILDCADPAMPPGCPADFNDDGVVDDADFVLFIVAYDALFCF